MSRRRSTSQGNVGGALIVALLVVAIAGPFYLGAWLAVQFGAENPSTARTLVGWIFEVPWLVFVAFMALRLYRRRREYQRELAAYHAVRPTPGPGGSTVYHHGGCTINHRTAEAAGKCRKG